jgi:hypothetical protein
MTRLRSFLDDETGSAAIEFCFVIPIVMMIFLASVESSTYMARHVMLERSVDIVVRDIRLGNYDSLTHAELKEQICEGDLLMPVDKCIAAMRIWMQPINTADFAMVAPPRFCLDRSAPIDPLVEVTGTEFAFGSDNEIMLLRICLMQDPLFRTSIFGPRMIPVENDDRYALVTTTVFVNEPG